MSFDTALICIIAGTQSVYVLLLYIGFYCLNAFTEATKRVTFVVQMYSLIISKG